MVYFRGVHHLQIEVKSSREQFPPLACHVSEQEVAVAKVPVTRTHELSYTTIETNSREVSLKLTQYFLLPGLVDQRLHLQQQTVEQPTDTRKMMILLPADSATGCSQASHGSMHTPEARNVPTCCKTRSKLAINIEDTTSSQDVSHTILNNEMVSIFSYRGQPVCRAYP